MPADELQDISPLKIESPMRQFLVATSLDSFFVTKDVTSTTPKGQDAMGKDLSDFLRSD